MPCPLLLSLWFAAVGFFLPVIAPAQPTSLEFFVAPNGNDGAAGSIDAPFASLERARDAMRAAKESGGLPEGGATITLREGTYRLTSTFRLDERDSGAEQGRITYRAHPGEEVRLIGGEILDPQSAQMQGDSIVVFDLSSLGITDYGTHVQYGHGHPVVPAPLELFFDREAMQLARYPNDASMKIGPVIDAGSVPRVRDYANRGGIFEYTDDRHERWVGLDDVWLQGTFMWGYADDKILVESIDPVSKTVKLATPHMYGVGTDKDYRQYYALNIRSELDAPGEWYLDRNTGELSFLPPAPIQSSSEIAVSILEDPFISIRDASYVTIRDITLEYGRGMGIYMEGGEHNLLAGLTVRNMGTIGILVGQGARQTVDYITHDDYEGEPASEWVGSLSTHLYHNTTWTRNAGHNHTIRSCDVYNTGAGGVFMGGGDRSTLEPGNSSVENSRFWNNQRRYKFIWSGIQLDGVGNRVANNEVFGSDYQAIIARGNEHVFEYNHIHHIGFDSDDTSPWGMGRDPSGRGNIVRYNFFHDVGRPDRMGMGVYMDDGTSGTLVHGNVFRNVASYGTVYNNAGSDNVITNNIFVDGFGPALHIKSMWFSWAVKHIPYYWDPGGEWEHRLKDQVDIKKPPYSERYPELINWLDLMPDGKTYYGMIPRRNVFARNLIVDYEEVIRLDHPNIELEVDDNWTTYEDPGFIDRANDNFGLRDDSPVFEMIPGFERIPFERIGIHEDEYKTRKRGSPQ
ncbi:MAG TPA: right-handed parallel beta-helix repeat-containing protein [Rhodothermales bacterium]|nr:right-handed parallel beta-helix repeat-containing protein [Rhodothermales bacterium]